ncbi:MAG: class I SAM-dependent methyltransferase [Anaerolineales bacterium]
MSIEDLNAASRQAWEQLAPFWDERQGVAGNVSHREIIAPAAQHLLDVQPGDTVLDAACGNGVFARRLASAGADVVGFDFSAGMIERAQSYAAQSEHRDRMQFQVMDATDEAQLLTLGAGRFEAAACLMAFMDMPEIAPLCRAMRQLLKPDGTFVFAVLHPCFNSADKIVRVSEEEDRDGTIVEAHSIKISRYLTPTTHKGLAIVGQPVAQYYFHRPLHVLLNTCFEAGFVLDALEEPLLPPREGLASSWASYADIPPFLVARLKNGK